MGLKDPSSQNKEQEEDVCDKVPLKISVLRKSSKVSKEDLIKVNNSRLVLVM